MTVFWIIACSLIVLTTAWFVCSPLLKRLPADGLSRDLSLLSGRASASARFGYVVVGLILIVCGFRLSPFFPDTHPIGAGVAWGAAGMLIHSALTGRKFL